MAVAVPVNVQLDARSISQSADKGIESSVLRSVARRLSLVCLTARVGAGSSWVAAPSELPVTIDITTDTSIAIWTILSVLAPESIDVLGMNEA